MPKVGEKRQKKGPKRGIKLVEILFETDKTILRVYPPIGEKTQGIIEHLERRVDGWLATQTILSKEEWQALRDFFEA